MRTTLLDLRRRAALGLALLGAGALAGCGLDFKVVVAGIPADASVSGLLVSFDSDGRRADAAMPVDLSKFAVENRRVSADDPDPVFTFALDAVGLPSVSGSSRVSVAAISTSGSAKCLRVTGATQAALGYDNPGFVDLRVDLLPQVMGTQQVPSAMPGCNINGPIILGVRRELSGPLDQSRIRFFLNGWNFGIKNKVTVRRCDPVFSLKQGATCEVPPRCIGPMANCCTPKDLAISCAVSGSSDPIPDMYFSVESVGKAAIVLTVKPGIFTNDTDGFLNLLAFPFPLHFTVEPQDAGGTPGANATYVEPQQQILTM